MAAVDMFEPDAPVVRIRIPAHFPVPHGQQYTPEIQPHFRQPVLVALGHALVLLQRKHARFHQLVEPLGQHGLGNAKPLVEIRKAPDAAECFAQQAQDPPISDDS